MQRRCRPGRECSASAALAAAARFRPVSSSDAYERQRSVDSRSLRAARRTRTESKLPASFGDLQHQGVLDEPRVLDAGPGDDHRVEWASALHGRLLHRLVEPLRCRRDAPDDRDRRIAGVPLIRLADNRSASHRGQCSALHDAPRPGSDRASGCHRRSCWRSSARSSTPAGPALSARTVAVSRPCLRRGHVPAASLKTASACSGSRPFPAPGAAFGNGGSIRTRFDVVNFSDACRRRVRDWLFRPGRPRTTALRHPGLRRTRTRRCRRTAPRSRPLP